jgi:hypothetical protein
MRSGLPVIFASIAVGAALALLTGLVDVTPPGLVGATWYGLPLPWLYRLVVAPQYNPWNVNSISLILDIGFWCVIALGAAVVVKDLKARRSTGRAMGASTRAAAS